MQFSKISLEMWIVVYYINGLLLFMHHNGIVIVYHQSCRNITGESITREITAGKIISAKLQVILLQNNSRGLEDTNETILT